MASPLDVLLGAQVMDTGVPVTPRRYIDLRTGLTVTDDPATDSIRVSATGGGGGVLVGDVNGDADDNVVTRITGTTGDVSMVATSLSWGAPGSSQLKVNAVDGAIELWNDAVRCLKADSSAPVIANTASVTEIQGGVKHQIVTIASNIALDSTTKDFIGWVDASAPRTITLPVPSAGRTFVLVNVGASAVTIARNASETINGVAANYVVPIANCIVQIFTNGTNWFALPVFDPSAGGYVLSTRTIGTTAPLTGGGDLSANRTFAVSNATTGAVGVVQLAQDLGGTGALPTVLGLTGTANVVALHGTAILADAGAGGRLNFISTGLAVPAGTFSTGTSTAKVFSDSYGAFGATHSGVWLGVVTPALDNVALVGDGTSTVVNAVARVQMAEDGVIGATFTSDGLRIGDTSDPTERLDVIGNVIAGATSAKFFAGSFSGEPTNYAAIYLGNITRSLTNHTLYSNGVGDTRLNTVTKLAFSISNATGVANITASGLRIGDETASAAPLDVQGNAFLGTTTSAHQFIGSQRWTTRSLSANLVIDTTTTDMIVLVDTSAARSVTLPAATNGRMLVIKDKTGSASTNNITITRAAAESIEGVAANYVFATDWGSLTLVSDGTNWFIIG